MARCYAESAGIKGHRDEELHGLDYLVYAFLQKGENDSAKKQYDYLAAMSQVYPENFKVAYAFAAVPARYVLENKMWKQAADLKLLPQNFPWQKFPWQKAIFHFARLMGAVNSQNMSFANTELISLQNIYDTIKQQKKEYMANQVLVQLKTGQAWIQLREGKHKEAIQAMNAAVNLEDKTEKSPVTPGEVIPAREFMADMQMELKMPGEALLSYKANLKTHPNRFNSLYGAGLASEKINDIEKANHFYRLLTNIAKTPNAQRPELKKAALFLQMKNTLAKAN